MDEYIERKAVANAFQKLLSSPHTDIHNGPFNAGVRDALQLARDMVLDNVPGGQKIPPADVVPVVRCCDCELWEAYTDNNGDEGLGWCENGCGDTTNAMYFCASGRRKEGDKNEKESDL